MLQQINIPGSTNSSLSYLAPLTALLSVDIQSTVSLTGETIVINPCLFQDVGTVNFAPVTLPTDGYAFVYPGTLGTITVASLSYPNQELWQNIELKVDIVSDTEFAIWVEGLMTADQNGFIDSDIEPDNLSRIYRNYDSNPNTFNNTGNSVYSKTKQLTYLVAYDDGANLHHVYASRPITARWLEKGINNASPVTSAFGYQLERGSQIVSNLSVFENTTVRFNITSPSMFPSFKVAIARVDNINGSGAYYDELELNYGVLVGASFIQQFTTLPITALVSGSLTNTSGNNYEGTVELNKDYFTVGASYRLYFVFQNLFNSFNESYYTEVEIVADDAPEPTYGTLTSKIQTYDNGSVSFTGNCVKGLTPRERVRIWSEMNISNYDDNVLLNNTTGDYLTNLSDVSILFTTTPPTNTGTAPASSILTPTKNADGSYYYDMRIPDNWAGQVYYAVFVYRFKLGTSPNDYTDVISHPIKLQVNDFDTTMTLVSTQIDGEDIRRVCQDAGGLLNLTFSSTTYDSDYSFFAAIRDNASSSWKEEDNYQNTNLAQLDTDEIILLPANWNTNPFISIDVNQLDTTKSYTVTIFAKRKTAADPPVCTASTVDSTQETILVRNAVQKISILVTSALASSLISDMTVTYTDGNGNVQTLSSGGANTVGKIFSYSTTAASPRIDYSVVIDLVDGCQLTGNFYHQTTEGGGAENKTTTVNP